MNYEKESEREMRVLETYEQKTVYSYDFILNKIQELEEQLVIFENLKEEADKFGLKR